jgi:hypothetical protein
MTKGDKIYLTIYFIFYIVLAITFYNYEYIRIQHLVLLPFILLYIFKQFIKLIKNKINVNYISILILTILILEFIILKFRDAAYQLYFLTSFLAVYNYFKDKTINISTIKKIVIISILLVPILRIMGFEEGQNILTLVPTKDNHWIINFGAPGQTLHLAAYLSGLFFISEFYRFKLGAKNYFILIVAIYLLIFTISRSVWLATSASIIYIFYFRKAHSYEKLFPILILVFFITIIYSSPFIIDLIPLLRNEFMRTQADDISAGREFLWKWHYQLFTENIFGHGREYLDQFSKGDVVNGKVIPAWSESYFTYNFAEIGIFAFANIFYYFYVVMIMVKKRNPFKISIALFAVLTTVGSSLVAGPYSIIWFLTIPLLAANIKILKA